MSEANRGRGQPRRGYRRTKPATRSGAGRLWSRRAAGFLLHTFLSPPKEKCERPMGRPVPIRAGVGASAPTGAGVCACGRTGGFPLAPSPLRIATRNNRAPHRVTSPSSAPESARQALSKGNFLRQSCLLSCKQGGFTLAPLHPLRGVGIPMG